jgi:hypothetical protein
LGAINTAISANGPEDDRQSAGIRLASSAGMMTVMLPDLLEPTDEIRKLCIVVARGLREVLTLILAMREVRVEFSRPAQALTP